MRWRVRLLCIQDLLNSLLIYIYIYWQNLEKIQLDFTIKVQFCAMYPKLFIFRGSFIFLILELNVGPHHKYSFK